MNQTLFEPKQFPFRRLCLVFCLFLLRGVILGQTAQPYDILINEFMADPAPPLGLPNAEFIELYNRSTKAFDLKDYKVINGSVSTLLPTFLLKSKSYVIIYKQKTGISFGKYGDTIVVDKLGTLSNPTDSFYLASPSGVVIDAASYDLSFYQNSKKAAGGFTLERIKPNAPCNPLLWIASDDLSGGTPGKRNSVAIDSTENEPPQLDRYFFKDEKTIVLIFNKSLDRTLAEQTPQYSFVETVKISSANIVPPAFQFVQLKLGTTLQAKTEYHLLVKSTLKDCQGIPLSKTDTLRIQLPEKPILKDLIINEILTNPETNGSRFVEIYNRSTKVMDIANLKIGDKAKGDIKGVTSNFLLFPRQYVALTESPLYIQKRYNATDFRKNIIKNKLPTWDEKAGNVVLYFVDTSKTIVLDSFTYNKSWHNPLLANTEGVSLERIDHEKPATESVNWQSAAQTVGYATPAQKNSQYLDPSVLSEPKSVFALEKKSFSPDEDGFEDFLRLNYRFDKAGFTATIRIFDDKGRLVKTLINNTLLSTEGMLKWEGDTDEGLKTRHGIYIIAIEWISTTGKVDRMKLACVVAGRL